MATLTPTISTDLLLAAATAAFRVNGDLYIKAIQTIQYDSQTRTMVDNPHHKRPNGILTGEFTANPETITTEDRTRAGEIRTLVRQTLSMKILKDEPVSDFENKILTLVSQTEVPDAKVFTSVAAYIPQYYTTEVAKRALNSRLYSAERSYLGEPNTKVSTTIEVVQMFYSHRYDCSFYTALTGDNKRVRFAYSGQAPIIVNGKYSIKATVKRCDSDWVTVLGRVKPTPLDNNSES
jgi:hypothetical protein